MRGPLAAVSDTDGGTVSGGGQKADKVRGTMKVRVEMISSLDESVQRKRPDKA